MADEAVVRARKGQKPEKLTCLSYTEALPMQSRARRYPGREIALLVSFATSILENQIPSTSTAYIARKDQRGPPAMSPALVEFFTYL